MTKNDLCQLLSSANDQSDDHILWINNIGKVHISPLKGMLPEAWEKKQKGFKFRWGIFGAGEGFCGEGIDSDPEYIQASLDGLLYDWKQGKSGCITY